MEIEMEGSGQHLQRVGSSKGGGGRRDFVLQWGNRKRLRCVKLKKTNPKPVAAPPPTDPDYFNANKTTSSAAGSLRERDSPSPPKKQRAAASSSPEKGDKYYSTRGGCVGDYGNFLVMDGGGGNASAREEKSNGSHHVWPKLFVSLSSKEKEEDFMAMKGCKLPQRPKKRPKLVQRSLLLVSPGAWLSDLCQERYEVREKKASKRRPRGLKAMGSTESESD